MGEARHEIPDIPRSLQKSFMENHLILFVGSGLSRNAGAPTWKELLLGLMGRFEDECISIPYKKSVLGLIEGSASDILWAAEYLKSINGELIGQHIREVCRDLVPQTVHDLIAKMPVAGIITTNYDNLIERAVLKEKVSANVILPHNAEALSNIEDRVPWVLKLHGSLENVADEVTGIIDIETMPASLAATLSRLLQRFTFLFVGFGLKDPDTLQQLAQLRIMFEGYQRRHYALCEETDIDKVKASVLGRVYKIQVLPYKKSRESHPEVSAFLTQLLGVRSTPGWLIVKKLLFVIPRPALDPGSELQLLVRCPDSGDLSKDIYWLPSLTDSIELTEEYLVCEGLRYGRQHWRGFSEDLFQLELDSRVFRQRKYSASYGQELEHVFRFAYVQLDEAFAKKLGDQVRLGGHVFEWQAISSLMKHPLTLEYNGDVIEEIVRRLVDRTGE